MEKQITVSNVELRKRWIYVILGVIIMMCLGTVYSWSVFRYPIEKLFEIGTTQSGLPYMVSLAFYSFFMFLSGRYLNKYSPRKIISIGGFLVTIGWLLSSYTSNIYVLTITYGVIIGAGVGIAYGPPMAVVAKWFPEKKGLVVGIVLIGFGLSPLITAPLVRMLIENYGVMKSFMVLGISFGVIIPALAYPFKYPLDDVIKPLEVDSSSKKDVKEINQICTSEMVKSQNFKGLYLNFIIGTMIGLMIIGITGNVGTKLIKLSPNTVALLMSVFAVFNGLGRPIFGVVTERLSHKKAMLISYILIISASLIMLITSENSVMLYSISFSIFWFNLGGWLAIAPTSTISMYGIKYYSENYGVVFTAYGIGAISGVLISGLLIDTFNNYKYIFYFVIGICIIGIILSQTMIKDKS